jgi:hypothetical protein
MIVEEPPAVKLPARQAREISDENVSRSGPVDALAVTPP